ncbi:MAG: hypothetical protein ACI8PB_004690 [Desulforhopalus sp.]|jgi:hypothetical protein
MLREIILDQVIPVTDHRAKHCHCEDNQSGLLLQQKVFPVHVIRDHTLKYHQKWSILTVGVKIVFALFAHLQRLI